jgi:hypothetical protein
MRLNLTLDDEHAEVLRRLAAQTHMQPGTIARSMLLTMLDRTVEQERGAGAPADVVQILDGVDGAYERLMRGRREAETGQVKGLDSL